MKMEMTATKERQARNTVSITRFFALLHMARQLRRCQLTSAERRLCLQCYDLGYLRGCIDGASVLAQTMRKGK